MVTPLSAAMSSQLYRQDMAAAVVAVVVPLHWLLAVGVLDFPALAAMLLVQLLERLVPMVELRALVLWLERRSQIWAVAAVVAQASWEGRELQEAHPLWVVAEEVRAAARPQPQLTVLVV